MTTICFVMPYFGRWPQWFDLYLSSCGRNPTIQWTFITDCGVPESPPPNTRFVSMTWAECWTLIKTVCPEVHPLSRPYKLCDFRFAFGEIFRAYISNYQYYGFGDIDVIYGDLRAFLTSDVLRHDLVTFNATHVAGHFTLLRNGDEVVTRYKQYDAWRARMGSLHYDRLDEEIGYYGIDDVYAVESFNTPLSPYLPWTDGTFSFPYAWYYKEGKLFTNLDGSREFMYLHFMRYKQVWRAKRMTRIVHLEDRPTADNWKFLIDGFHPYYPGDEITEQGRRITLEEARS